MIVTVSDCYDSTDGNLLLDLAKQVKWKSHGPSAEPVAARPNTSYKLKGYEFLNPSVTPRSVGSGSPLEQDVSMYLTKAASYVARARREADQDVTDDHGNNGKNNAM